MDFYLNQMQTRHEDGSWSNVEGRVVLRTVEKIRVGNAEPKSLTVYLNQQRNVISFDDVPTVTEAMLSEALTAFQIAAADLGLKLSGVRLTLNGGKIVTATNQSGQPYRLVTLGPSQMTQIYAVINSEIKSLRNRKGKQVAKATAATPVAEAEAAF